MHRQHRLIGSYTLRVSSTEERILVELNNAYSICGRHKGVAEAEVVEHDYLPEETWYVNRVLIEPLIQRGKGLGTALMTALIDEVRRRKGKHILLEPYGYGSDPKRLRRFYGRLGFIPFIRGQAKFISKSALILVVRGVQRNNVVPRSAQETRPRSRVRRPILRSSSNTRHPRA
jgi:predicted GNAT family acetyltransferase